MLPPRIAPLLPSTRTAATDTYTLSLHDALPISTLPQVLTFGQDTSRIRALFCSYNRARVDRNRASQGVLYESNVRMAVAFALARSEEHTSELQSLTNLVCRLLLEKKTHTRHIHH